MSLTLTPQATLYFQDEPFDKDWRQSWFSLAANKHTYTDPSLSFWQKIASHYLTSLCHLPEDVETVAIDPPSLDLMNDWILRAPPLLGGEYLQTETLLKLWNSLNDWVIESCKNSGVHPFLASFAPLWKQVGRVCFHLAENKRDQDRPFAFLATYSTGFSKGGSLQHLPLGQALKAYAGSDQKQALIKLLTPVQNASEKCPWVKDLATSGELYQPLAWPIHKTYQFLSSIPLLEECGLSVRIPNWWKTRQRPKVLATASSKSLSNFSASSLLEFDVGIAIGELQLTEEELSELMNSTENLVCFKGQWIEVDRDKLAEALKHWKQVQKLSKNGSISFIQGMRLLAGAPIDMDAPQAPGGLNEWSSLRTSDSLSEVLQNLRDPSRISSPDIKHLQATLRNYQQIGINWLHFLVNLGVGACLADDMGLGKTVQILALLQRLKNEGNCQLPSLLVVPASLLANWKQEASRFTPDLKLILLHPSEGKMAAESFHEADLVITTYGMATRLESISKASWQLVILDEAQSIKNGETKQAKSVKSLRSKARIALTGTPVENRLSDLWSLFDFLNPMLLGKAKKFKEFTDELSNFEPLRKLVSPYILRRMKTDPKVISDLPDKIETPAYCHLSKEQVSLYQAAVNHLAKMLEKVEDAKDRRGAVLKTLLDLKQICNHPSQYLGTSEFLSNHSGKFERLKQIAEELAARQEKVLVFTQFKEIIPALDDYLSEIFGRRGLTLHGGTPISKRKELVHAFQTQHEIPYFVLSIKAGGTGLTLTAANHVIHFDRWWNPAVENQATDRAFRIGQKKNVQVHKFITLGTVEEKIDEMITAKTKLSHDLFSTEEEVSLMNLSDSELLNFLNLNIEKAME